MVTHIVNLVELWSTLFFSSDNISIPLMIFVAMKTQSLVENHQPFSTSQQARCYCYSQQTLHNHHQPVPVAVIIVIYYYYP